MDTPNSLKFEVVEILVDKIKVRIRLRLPDDGSIQELAESIKTTGLINPITIDAQNYLIAGFHRWSAVKALGWKTIPAIIKDTSGIQSELIEIDENLKRNELNHIDIADHIVKREELLEELGVRMKRGGNQYSSGLVTTTELAEQLGMSNRIYRLKRQPANLNPEVKGILNETIFSDNLMDMVALSREADHIQLKAANLLSTGMYSTFKRALAAARAEDFRQGKEYKIGFSVKDRWGIPQSIMKFRKAGNELQKVCNLISKDEELEWHKRKDMNFGQSNIPVYGMAADLAEFLITYYTPENGLILDQFSGRFTIGCAALMHGRSFVGYDLNPKNVERARQVISDHICSDLSRYTLHDTDGVSLKEYDGCSEYFDGIVTDPPYVLKAEVYSEDPREIGNLDHKEYMKHIKLNMQRCYDLIKTSSFEEKIFHPVIFKVGTGRKGNQGIVDMDTDFQIVARDVGFVLWDELSNELNTPFKAFNFERNYLNKYVQKNYEVNLVFCKFA